MNNSDYEQLLEPIAPRLLTKREYFAALCLSGLMARDNQNGIVTNRVMVPDVAAKEAVAFADALIIELNKETK